ncbi:MAG: hypothetical protein HS107_07355 [Thermoflexaceae bacterium]|nr:hypothetical protein [Thermoflexaceae bacterium]
MTGGGPARRVTRAVTPEDLRPLLEHPRRATMASVADGSIHVMPVAFHFDEGRYLVGLPTAMTPPAGRVKVLVDDGPWYFDLRGVWAKGPLVPCDAPDGVSAGHAWFELVPEKAVAWHYGRMRETP